MDTSKGKGMIRGENFDGKKNHKKAEDQSENREGKKKSEALLKWVVLDRERAR